MLREARNTAGRRVPFQHAFRHGLADGRCGFAQRGFRNVGLLFGDGCLDFLYQVLYRAQRGTVPGLPLDGLASSTNRRFMDDWHSKLLYKRNAFVSQGWQERQGEMWKAGIEPWTRLTPVTG